VGDLLALHAEAGIELRVLPHLQDLWAAVITSTVGFSGIRLRHAVPRPDGSAVTPHVRQSGGAPPAQFA
jgi:hypothetical protein